MNNTTGNGELGSGRSARVARALELANRTARAIAGGRQPGSAPGVLSAVLAQQVLPQLESGARLASGVPGHERDTLVAELTEQRHHLGPLVEALDHALLETDTHGQRSPAARRRMLRTLAAVAQLLERHLATEERLWHALAAGCSDEKLSALVQEAEEAERRAAGSLRFVWHPPVPETEAKALWWTSPKTRRVFVVDAAGAAALEGASGGTTSSRRKP